MENVNQEVERIVEELRFSSIRDESKMNPAWDTDDYLEWLKETLTPLIEDRNARAREVVGEKIICSAVRFKDKVWMGHRHMHAMEAMHNQLSYTMNRKEMNEQQTDRDQGFITSTGRYVGREEAWDIAEKCGQLNDRKDKTPGYLYSEDVW